MMKVSIVINNYNYSDFIIECVDSAFAQTYKNIEIIIIDDGSIDNSVFLLDSNYSKYNKIKIVKKENAGQLSTFNKSLEYITGDIVCFLDADDLYKLNYIEKLVDIYQKNIDIDFIFSAIERFYIDGRKEIVKYNYTDLDLGFSIMSTLYTKEWIGNVTSTVSMRVNLFKQIFPIPFEQDWITRADDCLIWGASIFGAHKYYYSEPLVLYRVHKTNNYFGKIFSNTYLYKREIAISRLFKYLLDKTEINIDFINLINMEFRSRGDKNIKLLLLYLSLFKYKKGLILKIKMAIRLIQIYIHGEK